MLSIAFLSTIIILFVIIFAWERNPDNDNFSMHPMGLLSWLTSGNWPAKVGACLLIIGSGALLRYFMLSIEWPNSSKLFLGVILSVTFGGISGWLSTAQKYRALHLSMGGASLATAYLTAYSAYGLFQYITSIEALALLFVIASSATVFSISSRSLSVAVLAMLGAYIAPAFSLGTTGPVPVYGYYLAASLLTLLMVWIRGWRPLIHLSFLFTLAGALFFGWTQKFYTPPYFLQMQPLLLALVAVHLAMPLFENRNLQFSAGNNLWLARFDLGYNFLLPLTSLTLALLIAPDLSKSGAISVLTLALLWIVAAGIQYLRFKQGTSHYLGVALVFFLISAMLGVSGLSFFLMTAIASCTLLALGSKWGVPEQFDGMLIAAALASAISYFSQTLFEPVAITPFLNHHFAQQALLLTALTVAGSRMRLRTPSMASLFSMLAGGIFVIASAREFIHLHLEHLPQIFHLLTLFVSLVYAIWLIWKPVYFAIPIFLGIALFFTGLLSAKDFSTISALLLMLAGQLIFSSLAYVAGRHDEGESAAGISRSMLPILLLPWAIIFSHQFNSSQLQVVMTMLVLSALLATLQAQLTLPKGRFWPNTLSPVGVIFFGIYLFYQTLFDIQREPWAIVYELVALIYLILSARFLIKSKNIDAQIFNIITMMASISVISATFLRLFGPSGNLTVFAYGDMFLPAVVSLLWAIVGGVLSWYATKVQSRKLWVLGAMILSVVAIKLVLFDFDSLGQLSNIFAMMAAGAVFLLVAWLAPFPPKVQNIGVNSENGELNGELNVSRQTIKHSSNLTRESDAERSIQATSASSVNQRSISTEKSIPTKSETMARDIDSYNHRSWIWIVVGLLVFGYCINVQHEHFLKRRAVIQAQSDRLESYKLEADIERKENLSSVSNTSTKDEVLDVNANVDIPSNHSAGINSVSISKNEPTPVQEFTSAVPVFPEGTELHAIGVYEAALPAGQQEIPWWKNCPVNSGNTQAMLECHTKYAGVKTPHIVTVNVTRTKAPMVVALMAYEPVIWNIKLNSGAVIKKVILSGYHGQDINGLADNVPVEVRTYEVSPCNNCSRHAGYFYSYSTESTDFPAMVNKLRTITGLELKTFQGAYKSDKFILSNYTS